MYLFKIIGFAVAMVHDKLISLPTGVANPLDYSFIVASQYAFPGFFVPF